MSRRDLPCFTTADEMRPVVDGALVQALTEMMNTPADPSAPVDPQLLENEKVWATGDKDLWMELEFKRIFARKK